MKPIPTLRRRAARLAALGISLVAALAVTASPAAAATIPAGGMSVEHASLDWTGSKVMQAPFPAGPTMTFFHYFSAGVSDGSEAAYKGAEGNAQVLLEAEGPEAVATWATRENYGAEAGHHQVVRLLDGTGRIEADGAAKISWNASFSVNFYSGQAPFSIENPTLTVNADGSGELTATLSGCKANRAEPAAGCVPFPAAPGTQVATFSGVHIDPDAPLSVTPSYAGVEVETPGAEKPQNRTVPGWGAWPQSMVTFQDQTGLSSYFYSSGSPDDPNKAPLPFVVDLKGPRPTPPATSPSPPATQPAPAVAPAPQVTRPGKFWRLKGVRKVRSNGVVPVAKLHCPQGGAVCRAIVPRRIAAKIAGKRYVLGVMAPKKVGAGETATARVHFPKAARKALGKKKLLVRLNVRFKANGKVTKRAVRTKVTAVRVKGKAR